MDFIAHLRNKYGSHWVLANRLTVGMKAKGYKLAITPKMYRAEELAWAKANPAEVLAQLPRDTRELLTVAGLLNAA